MTVSSLLATPPSRLILGTVQFGMNYGIANETGQPSFDTVCSILRIAYDGGVTVLDTAAGYAQSEEVLGKALARLGLLGRMRVVTKVAPVPPGSSSDQAAAHIENSVTRSIKLLGLERLELCLFHRESNLDYVDQLVALEKRGLIAAGGVSVNSPEGARRALGIPEMKAWQIPSNILDRRYTHSGITAAAHQAGTLIFVRSTYLQGLLLMDDDKVPAHLTEVIAARKPLRDLAARFGIPYAEFILRAMLSRPDLSSLVVGVETEQQMRGNVELFAKGPLPAEVAAALDATPLNVSGYLVTPIEWEKIVPARR